MASTSTWRRRWLARLIDDVTQNRCDIAMFAIGISPLRGFLMTQKTLIVSGGKRLVYDALDPAMAPGVGSPEPHGLAAH